VTSAAMMMAAIARSQVTTRLRVVMMVVTS
jgi:hypothetical protein